MNLLTHASGGDTVELSVRLVCRRLIVQNPVATDQVIKTDSESSAVKQFNCHGPLIVDDLRTDVLCQSRCGTLMT